MPGVTCIEQTYLEMPVVIGIPVTKMHLAQRPSKGAYSKLLSSS